MKKKATNLAILITSLLIVSIFVVLVGGYAGSQLQQFGFGAWGLMLILMFLGPIFIGIFTLNRLSLCCMSFPVAVFAFSFMFNFSITATSAMNLYEFKVAHGSNHKVALKESIDFSTIYIAFILSGLGPLAFYAKAEIIDSPNNES